MKKMLILGIAALMILVSIRFANSQYLAADGQKDAIAVVKAYLNALIEGDTETIRESMGGYLLEKRQKLLDNPGYPSFLREAYKNASFEILNFKFLKKNSMQIDVRIDLNEKESRQLRFLLIKKAIFPDSSPQFRIYSETEMTN